MSGSAGAAGGLQGPPPRRRRAPPRRGAVTAAQPPHASAALPSAAAAPPPAAERVGAAPPLFPYCRALVNHRYRTLYLKAPKTGSTSLLTLLGTCTGDELTDKPTCFKPLQVGGAGCGRGGSEQAAGAAHPPACSSLHQCQAAGLACRCRRPCTAACPCRAAAAPHSPSRLAQPMKSREAYEQLYSDYFVWTVVRNPWARAVSSYRMLSRYMRRECKVRRAGRRRAAAAAGRGNPST